MSQQGEHTWDLVIHYHRCPHCCFIMENRQNFRYRMGKYIKDLECSRCHHKFTVTKARQPSFGPLIGEPQPKETDWS